MLVLGKMASAEIVKIGKNEISSEEIFVFAGCVYSAREVFSLD